MGGVGEWERRKERGRVKWEMERASGKEKTYPDAITAFHGIQVDALLANLGPIPGVTLVARGVGCPVVGNPAVGAAFLELVLGGSGGAVEIVGGGV